MRPEPIAKILPHTLQTIARARSVRAMTTNAARDYRAAQLAALLIEWAWEQPDGESWGDPQAAAKGYVQHVLDNGFTTPSQATTDPDRWVWELVEILGFGPDFDPFAAHVAISRVIDETDLFND